MEKKQLAILGLGSALLFALFFNPMRQKKDMASLQTPKESKPGDIIITDTLTKGTYVKEEKLREKRVQLERQKFMASSMYGIRLAVPTRAADNSFIFKIKYEPIGRACLKGDVEYISERSKNAPKILFTVDSDSEATEIFKKNLTADQLKTSFTADLKIPPTKTAKVYRIALCSADGNDNCKNATPLPMDTGKKEKTNRKIAHQLFYAQTFVVEKSGIKFLDNMIQDLEKKNPDPGKAFGAHLGDSPYLKQVAHLNTTLKPLPTLFKQNELTMNLYYRDIEACQSMGDRK